MVQITALHHAWIGPQVPAPGWHRAPGIVDQPHPTPGSPIGRQGVSGLAILPRNQLSFVGPDRGTPIAAQGPGQRSIPVLRAGCRCDGGEVPPAAPPSGLQGDAALKGTAETGRQLRWLLW